MKKFTKISLICSAILCFGSVIAQVPSRHILGTPCNNCPAPPPSSAEKGNNNNQIMNGNGTNGTSYTATSCGLNYTQATVRLNKRSFSMTPATGVNQPATFAISGMPPCFQVLKAYLYAGTSGNGVAVNASITNPAAVTQNFPMAIIGNHTDKCWGYSGTYTYRADVTSVISGNGNYVISGLPTNPPTAGNDTDGATLFIVYTDPTQNWTGSIVIADGANVAAGGTRTVTVGGFNVCGPTTQTQCFMMIGDLQKIANSNCWLNSNTSNFVYPTASNNVWDYITAPGNPATAGQTTATFGLQNTSDCFNVAVVGMYYRTNCNVCTSSNLTVTAVTSSSCSAGSATANVVGGTGPYTYTWSPTGGNGQSITNMPTGNYTVVTKDATGCLTGTATVAVNAASGPTITATNNASMCAGSSVNLTANGASTYTWSPSASLNTPNGPNVVASPGSTTTYSISGTNTAGCVSTITTQVIVNPLPVPVVNSNSPVCLNNPINLTASGGSSYSWSGPNSFTAVNQNPSIPAATTINAGVYSVTVTALGCSSVGTTSVSVLTPTTSASNTGPYCAGTTIQLNAPSATSYTWTGPGFNSNAQNPQIPGSTTANSGNYSLIVSIGTCTASAMTSVTVNPLPVPAATNTGPYCPGATIQLNVGAFSTYTWTGPAFNSNLQNPTITNAQTTHSGNYVVTVMDGNGCVNTSNTNVTVNPTPVITVNNPGTCVNQTINLTATGGNTYLWAGPNSFTSNVQNPNIPNAQLNMSGAYTVLVISAAGCTNTAVSNVTIYPLPSPNITSNSPVCAGGTLNLFGSGGATYAWSGPGYSGPTQNPVINNVTVGASGVYNLLVSSGTCTASTSYTVVINPLPTPNIVSNSPVCIGMPINFTGSGGSTYAWSGPGFNSGLQNPTIPSSAMFNNGTYTLTVTDANGCVNSITQGVTVNPQPIVSVTGNTVCQNFSANLSASGGVTYNWTGPGTYSATGSNASITNAQPSSSGQYTVIVTDANTCTNTAVATLIVNPAPTPMIQTNSPICINHVLSLSGSGGVNYVWSGPNGFFSSSQSPTVMANTTGYSGTYALTVSDANGCSASTTATVSVSNIPNVTIAASNNVGCPPLCVDFTFGSSSPVQSYYWELGNGSQGSTSTGTGCYNTTGIYTVNATINDAYGCSNSATYTVEVYPVPVADFNHAPIKPIVNIDPEVTFTDASWGANIVGWNWYFMNTAQYTSTSQNTSFMYGEPGTYAVALVVKSDHGCMDTLVRPLVVGEDFGLYVPNAFTPNGDGLNDIFQPKGFGITQYELLIYDRWGELMFRTNDFNEGWNGARQKNKDVSYPLIIEDGVYTWLINCTSVFGKSHELKGHVTLIK
jgi:gliding motility-associated-like protein